MKNFNRRDFLLHVAPLVGASGLILGSVTEMEAQIRNFVLQTPSPNAQLTVGQTVQISLAMLKVQYPKFSRIDFKVNGSIIGTTSNRPYQINWQPTQAGNFTLTAEAILLNGTIVTTPTVNVAVASSQLEVLYDTLGNATDGWGWAGQGGYTSTFSNALGLNYIIVTCYLGTLSSPKRLRGIECAVNGLNFGTGTYVPPSNFLGRFYIGIWRTDVGTFYQEPLGGSLTLLHGNLSDPNVGSVSIPVGFIIDGNGNQSPKYVIGWDNLDVLLPANVMIQIALYAEETNAGDSFGVSATSRPGPNMLRVNSDTGNGVIAQPMATRIKVSD